MVDLSLHGHCSNVSAWCLCRARKSAVSAAGSFGMVRTFCRRHAILLVTVPVMQGETKKVASCLLRIMRRNKCAGGFPRGLAPQRQRGSCSL